MLCSRRVAKPFKEVEARGLGAITFKGKLIDIMSYSQANNLVNSV